MDDSQITTEESDPAPTLRPLAETGIQETPVLPGSPAVTPAPTPPVSQKDREHLDILAVFYYILCGFECFALLLIPLYAVFVYVFYCTNLILPATGPQALPPNFGWILEGVLAVAFVFTGIEAILLGLTARDLRLRKHRIFCTVVAALHCLSVPLGTALGIFTILVLQRDSVKELFRTGEPPPVPEEEGPVYHPYEQREKDKQWLSVMAILHFVLGGFLAFLGILPLIYFALGITLLAAPTPTPAPGQPPPPSLAALGGIMIGLAVFMTVLIWGPAIMAILTGINLRRRKNWKLCLVGTAVQCVNGLIGIPITVITVIVLMRQSVRDLFKYGEPVTTTDEDYL